MTKKEFLPTYNEFAVKATGTQASRQVLGLEWDKLELEQNTYGRQISIKEYSQTLKDNWHTSRVAWLRKLLYRIVPLGVIRLPERDGKLMIRELTIKTCVLSNKWHIFETKSFTNFVQDFGKRQYTTPEVETMIRFLEGCLREPRELTDEDISMREFTRDYVATGSLKGIALWPHDDDDSDVFPETEAYIEIGGYPVYRYVFSDGTCRIGVDTLGGLISGICPDTLTIKEINAIIKFAEG